MRAMKYSDYVDYGKLDPFKRAVMEKLGPTFKFIEKLGIRVVPESIGEPAVLFDFIDYDFMLAFKSDGVGTKNKIADKMALNEAAAAQGMKLYSGFGRDLIAMNANDLICVGATPFALTDEVASGSSDWFKDAERVGQLLDGLYKGCELAGMTIPCGETPTLPDIIHPDSVSITGAAIGLVRPKTRAVLGERLRPGDVIYGIESDGIHSNGLSLARKIVEKLPEGYFTKLDGTWTVGEELLTPTELYVKEILEMLDEGVDIHYMSNITGSAWKKIARAKQPFTYIIENVPEPPPIFEFLQKHGDVTDEEAYKTWNMGIGFCIYAPASYFSKIKSICERTGTEVYELGRVEAGEKKVVISPKNIVYAD